MTIRHYTAGHVKREPSTGSVAIRTGMPDDDPQLAAMAWLIATPHRGAHNAATTDVDDWDDLYTPPEPDGGG